MAHAVTFAGTHCTIAILGAGWDLAKWDALYDDLPSRQTKLAVADRTVITTTADETRATAPAELQPELDRLAAQFSAHMPFALAIRT